MARLKAKTALVASYMLAMCLLGQFLGLTNLDEAVEIIGAGEGIRTLDPNLGKVVLYP